MIIWLFFWLGAFWNHDLELCCHCACCGSMSASTTPSSLKIQYSNSSRVRIYSWMARTAMYIKAVTTRQSSKPARLRRSKVITRFFFRKKHKLTPQKTQQLYTIWKDFQNTWEEFSIFFGRGRVDARKIYSFGGMFESFWHWIIVTMIWLHVYITDLFPHICVSFSVILFRFQHVLVIKAISNKTDRRMSLFFCLSTFYSLLLDSVVVDRPRQT